MSDCSGCGGQLQEGYGFCHTCGASVDADANDGAVASRSNDFVGFVDQLKTFSSRAQGIVNSANEATADLLGSPISIQRQVLYSVLAGIALAPPSPETSLLEWLPGWLMNSTAILGLVNYWVTGVFPLAGWFNAILGPERSLRRRLLLTMFLAWIYVGPMRMISFSLGNQFAGGGEESSPGWTFLVLNLLVASVLISFYLLGFVSNWRPVHGLEAQFGRDRLGGEAGDIARQVYSLLQNRGFPGLESTRVEMAKLRHYTAGLSSAGCGEQLSFVSGNARVVVFVQDFGDRLFVRWSGFFDGSGRRLWLFIGLIVSLLDGIFRRWVGVSWVAFMRGWIGTLAVGNRNHLVIESKRGGYFSRLLKLESGISEYSWNELYALKGAVEDAVIEALRSKLGEHEEVEEIRSQIERARVSEARSGWSTTTPS